MLKYMEKVFQLKDRVCIVKKKRMYLLLVIFSLLTDILVRWNFSISTTKKDIESVNIFIIVNFQIAKNSSF